MKSQTSQVARSCRIREWASMVQECRNRPRGRKVKGKREKDIQGLPVNPVEHKMSEEELIAEFGEDG